MAVALPMESNPETMNKYLHKLGVPEQWRMVDVVALEGDPLAWVPRPVLALILLFPLSDTYESHRQQQEAEYKQKETPQDLFHLKQAVSNICGTVALVHGVANNSHHIQLADGLLKSYINSAKGLDANDKGALLANSEAILAAYKDIVGADHQQEQSANNHFVTFIHKDGKLYELDGRKSFPVEHGPTSPESFLEDAARVCRGFVAREPDSIGFNVVALVPAQ